MLIAHIIDLIRRRAARSERYVWRPEITIRDGHMAADLMTFSAN